MRSVKEILTVLQELRETARENFRAEIVGVFGSYVKDEQKRTSDIDILVRFMDGATLFDLVGLADFLEEKLNVKVDIVPADTLREDIRGGVLKEAVYL